MNFQDLSTRYQISIGKILVKYNLDWDDIYTSTEKAIEAKQEIIMMLISDRILSTSDIANLLMTTQDQIGKIYNAVIKSRNDKPNNEEPKKKVQKRKLNTKSMTETPPTEKPLDDKIWLENHQGETLKEPNISPILKAQIEEVIENSNENKKLDDIKPNNTDSETPPYNFDDERPQTNRQNSIFETLVLEKGRVVKHLKAIEYLMEFYK